MDVGINRDVGDLRRGGSGVMNQSRWFYYDVSWYIAAFDAMYEH